MTTKPWQDRAIWVWALVMLVITSSPLWPLLDFHHPTWPIYLTHMEASSLSTYGRWPGYSAGLWVADAFSGMFPVYYGFLSDYFNNRLSDLTGVPVMVLQAVYLGPIFSALFALVNYFSVRAVLRDRTQALTVAMALSLYSYPVVDILGPDPLDYFNMIFHFPIKSLALDTGQTLGWLLFLPTLTAMYLADEQGGWKWPLAFGALLGLEVQTHSLTFVNLAFIAVMFVWLKLLTRLWQEGRRPEAGSVLILGILPPLVPLIGGLEISGLHIGLYCAALIAECFAMSSHRAFYWRSALGLAVVVSPYALFVLGGLGGMAQYAQIRTGDRVPLYAVIYFYMPFLVVVGIALWKEWARPTTLWAASALVATAILAFNYKFGWWNHPYRFAINMLFPMTMLAAIGITTLLRASRGQWFARVTWVWVGLGLISSAYAYTHNRRPHINYDKLSADDERFLSIVRAETKADEPVLLPPEHHYPKGSLQSAFVLNYSRAPGFLPDPRYVFWKERLRNRYRLFCRLFPEFPRAPNLPESADCPAEQAGFLAEGLRLKDPRVLNATLDAYGLRWFVAYDAPYSPILKLAAPKFGWKSRAEIQTHVLYERERQLLPGIVPLGRAHYDREGFHLPFTLGQPTDVLLALAGDSLGSHMGTATVDGKAVEVRAKSDRIRVLQVTLPPGGHELLISWPEGEAATQIRERSDYLSLIVGVSRDAWAQYFDSPLERLPNL